MLKVLHDCRRDADALLHQHKIRIENVFDTQAAYAVIKRFQARSKAVAAANGGGGADTASFLPVTPALTGDAAVTAMANGAAPVGAATAGAKAKPAAAAVECVSLGHLTRRLLGQSEASKENVHAAGRTRRAPGHGT